MAANIPKKYRPVRHQSIQHRHGVIVQIQQMRHVHICAQHPMACIAVLGAILHVGFVPCQSIKGIKRAKNFVYPGLNRMHMES